MGEALGNKPSQSLSGSVPESVLSSLSENDAISTAGIRQA